MPYDIKKDGRCSASKPWGVVKRSDGELMGCHETEAKAKAQIRALYATESAAARGEISLPKLRSSVQVAPDTFDAEARTVEVRFYSGASVQRFPFFDEPYELAFSLDPKAVRLDRFNAGAPVVDNHRDDLPVMQSQIGVVERAWLAPDGGHAIVKIAADRPDILGRIHDGILRNFSMGAVIHQMRDVTEKGHTQKHLLATDWEPHELSVVPVPADPGAQALSDQAERFPCQLIGAKGAPMERKAMTTKVRLLATGETVEIDESEFDESLHWRDLNGAIAKLAATDPKAEQRVVDDAIERDKLRTAEIKRVAAQFGLDPVWAQRMKHLSLSMEQIVLAATEEREKRAPKIESDIGFGNDFDSIGSRLSMMTDALVARGKRVEAPEPSRQYLRHSVADCALEILGLTGRASGRILDARRDPWEVIRLALHTTSDFPQLLANVMNKMLVPAYEQAQPTYRMIASRRQFNDFRPHSFLKAGDFPAPLQVNEGGEYQHGTMNESAESVTLVTYGRILGISRQILINDDLGAFDQIATAAARRVVDFENTTFFTICILAGAGLGPTLVEGTAAVYNLAAHGNVTGAGALDNTRLAAGLALMMAQTSVDGLRLNVMPRILLVSPTSYVTGRTLVTAITPAVAANVNPFAGQLEVIADANLTGTRFYMLADPGTLPNYIYGSIGGGGPRVEVRPGFEVDGVETKLSIDFGCGAIEYRGGVTGAGA